MKLYFRVLNYIFNHIFNLIIKDMIDQEIVKFLISWINENTIYEEFLLNLEIVVLDLEELQFMACRESVQSWLFFQLQI